MLKHHVKKVVCNIIPKGWEVMQYFTVSSYFTITEDSYTTDYISKGWLGVQFLWKAETVPLLMQASELNRWPVAIDHLVIPSLAPTASRPIKDDSYSSLRVFFFVRFLY